MFGGGFAIKEYQRILNNLSSVPEYHITTDKITAKKLLESESVFCNGDLRNIKVKHLGLGVYKVFSKPFKP